MTTTALMTAEELYALPKERRGELIAGVMCPMPPVDLDHVDDVGRLIRRIGNFAEEHAPGIVGPEGGFRLHRDPDTVLAPDVAYVRRDRVPPPGERTGFPDLAPDLAVEVRSPSNTAAEIARKVVLYLEAGTRLVWVVDRPRREVTSHAPGRPPRTLGVGDTLDGEDVLPGFTLPLAALFG
ncbi:MAG: Uma2 family endonuclease [Chloroflexia bacterium]|nr:Uma2 family endonuclease [Chloroflexia bacterium]